MPPNFASTTRGATIAGDGIGLTNLIDDTEASTWARLGAPGSVAGTQVTVRLDPSKPWHEISRVQVSAMLRTRNQNDPAGDATSQNLFLGPEGVRDLDLRGQGGRRLQRGRRLQPRVRERRGGVPGRGAASDRT
jgi:hypothetical protein